MCLAVIGKVVTLQPTSPEKPFVVGEVEVSGVRFSVSFALLEKVVVGDYVLLHAGFAIQKVDAPSSA